jgi:hypothetical protein
MDLNWNVYTFWELIYDDNINKSIKVCKIYESVPWISRIFGTKRSVRAILIEKRGADQFNDGTTGGRFRRWRRGWRSTNTLQCISVFSKKQSAIPCRHSDSEDLKLKRYTRSEWNDATSFRYSLTNRKWKKRGFLDTVEIAAPSRDLSWR